MTVQARIEKRARFASVSGRGVLVTHTGAYTKTKTKTTGSEGEGLTSG